MTPAAMPIENLLLNLSENYYIIRIEGMNLNFILEKGAHFLYLYYQPSSSFFPYIDGWKIHAIFVQFY